jgi:hypothetical protein
MSHDHRRRNSGDFPRWRSVPAVRFIRAQHDSPITKGENSMLVVLAMDAANIQRRRVRGLFAAER